MRNYKPKQGSVTESIYLLLKKKPMTGSDIRRSLPDATEKAISSAISRMKSAGAIGRDNEGVWHVGIEDSGMVPSPSLGEANSAVMKVLDSHGPLSSSKICFLSGMSKKKTHNAIYNLKRKGLIGKSDGLWGIGLNHEGVGSKMKRVLALVEEGRHTLDEMASALGMDKRDVSKTVVRIRNEYGLEVKTIYTLG
ncbi:hypothetical protein [Shewanella chilikensis]|uniref:hypothetical protein n=1 Tax=Shewanella chilikensis TaxID=558541 RepID=UPI003A987829